MNKMRVSATSVAVGLVVGHFIGFVLLLLVVCVLAGVLVLTGRKALPGATTRRLPPG